MLGQTLVFVCASFALVAGSCFQVPQQVVSLPSSCGSSSLSSVVSAPVTTSVVSSPVELLSSGSSFSSPVVSGDLLSAGSFSSPVVSAELLSAGSSFSSPVVSGGLLSAGSLGLTATNGPSSSPVQVIQAPSVTLPAQQGPAIVLSSPPIPAPRVLSQRCICTKTVVKPQVYQRTVTVPKIQRYIKRTVTPVVENVSYKSTPITSSVSSGSGLITASSGLVSGSGLVASSSPVVVSSGSGVVASSSPVVVSSGSSCSCY